MLIPAIDLMQGKVVQLVQGKTKALEFDDVEYWVERFTPYPLVHVIDLDAALGRGENRLLIKRLTARLRCQVGGGIQSAEAARELLAAGARKVIIGSALIADGRLNLEFARRLAERLDRGGLVFALDSRGGKVVVQGWGAQTHFSPLEMIRTFEPYCGGFLYTHVDTEGLMAGIPEDVVRTLREATARNLCVAGGIASLEQVEALDRLGIDAVVGMALYAERIHA